MLPEVCVFAVDRTEYMTAASLIETPTMSDRMMAQLADVLNELELVEIDITNPRLR
jgi:hypothetical protein